MLRSLAWGWHNSESMQVTILGCHILTSQSRASYHASNERGDSWLSYDPKFKKISWSRSRNLRLHVVKVLPEPPGAAWRQLWGPDGDTCVFLSTWIWLVQLLRRIKAFNQIGPKITIYEEVLRNISILEGPKVTFQRWVSQLGGTTEKIIVQRLRLLIPSVSQGGRRVASLFRNLRKSASQNLSEKNVAVLTAPSFLERFCEADWRNSETK